jgi:hypothetical protein
MMRLSLSRSGATSLLRLFAKHQRIDCPLMHIIVTELHDCPDTRPARPKQKDRIESPVLGGRDKAFAARQGSWTRATHAKNDREGGSVQVWLL